MPSEAAPATPEAYAGHDEAEAASHRSPSGASFEAPAGAEEPTPEEERPVGDFEDIPNDAISQENGLDAEEAEHIRQVVHHTADKTPSESVRSLDGSFRPPQEEVSLLSNELRFWLVEINCIFRWRTVVRRSRYKPNKTGTNIKNSVVNVANIHTPKS